MASSMAKKRARILFEANAAQMVKIDGRKTRGKRATNLDGSDAEADEEFWGQDAWRDGESEYSSEASQKDEFESDFNDSESDDEEDEEEIEKEVRRRERNEKRKEGAKKTVYKEPAKAKAKAKTASDAGHPSSAVTAARSHTAPRPKPEMNVRNIRASTKTRTEKSVLVREDEAKAAAVVAKRRKPYTKTKCEYTQAQLLLEATKTELENANWLWRQKKLQMESKEKEGRPKAHKQCESKLISRRGAYNTITFPEVDLMPTILKRTARPAPKERQRCVITGLPAKYKDPLTGMPYATAAAFKELRSRYPAMQRRDGRAGRATATAMGKA